jgi:aminopeptidase N
MLRRELGDEAFWAGIQRYAKTHREHAVETIDLQRAMEAESHRSLGWFFDQWCERPGHPVLDVSAAWRAEDKLLEVTIKQTQPGDPFRFTAEIGVPEIDLDSVRPGVDAQPRTSIRKIEVASREEHVYLPLAGRPRWVSFDPRQKLLCDLNLKLDRDQLEAALASDSSVKCRIDAARALGARGGDAAVAALAKALREDPFHGVRSEAARLLGTLTGDRPRDALLQALATRPEVPAGILEKDRVARRQVAEALWVRRAVVDALSGFHKDPKVAGALLAIVESGDPSCFVEASAARALARTNDPRAFDALATLLERPSHEEEIRRAAIEGLADLYDARALPIVKSWAARGKPRQVRHAALHALGRLAARKEVPEAERREVTDLLVSALEETSRRTRGSAMDALRELGAERALPALDALARHETHPDLRDRAKAAAERIRAGAPPDAEMARLREDLKAVVDENKALRDRLERLEARGGEVKGAAAPPAAVPVPNGF